MTLRNSLEVLGAQLTTKHLTDEDLEYLTNLYHEINKAYKENYLQKMSELNGEFHEGIVKASNNSFLIELSTSLGFQSWSAITAKHTKMDGTGIYSDHKKIIDCLINKDLEGIKENITKHNKNVIDSLNFDF